MKPFDKPALALGRLHAETTGRLLAAVADVALVLDGEGVIRDLALGSDDLLSDEWRGWIGKPWVQTVTVDSRAKVEALLRDSTGNARPSWRQINHPSTSGVDVPLLYSAVSMQQGVRGSALGRTVAFGRDLRADAALQQRLVAAQQSMERDYWRMRHMETRYRSLFRLAAEAVLIVDASSQKVEEINPAAERLFGAAARRAGWPLPDAFDPDGAVAVRTLLAAVRATGRTDSVRARLVDGSAEPTLSVSLFRQDRSAQFLVRAESVLREEAGDASDGRARLMEVVERAPDALVITQLDGHILTANRAFLDLAQLADEAQARGEPLERWLGRTGVDLNVLINNLRQLGAVRLFATTLRGEFGSNTEVEISAVAVTEGEQPCLGFVVRDVARRLTGDARGAREMPNSVGQMTELVGRMPLKDIVRDTTDMIEQLCIEAALELTQDNRASAAEMLGLSRQSLYVKLRRFNLGDVPAQADE